MDYKPEKVRVFGKNYQIKYIPEDEGMEELGLLDYDKLRIMIKENQPPIEEADTILHETVHAIDNIMGLELSEEQVRGIATGLIGVFQDNSEFAEFIIKQR